MKITIYTVLALLVTILLTFMFNGIGLFNIKFWGVKYEDARRQVFEETKSYNHGMIRDLENLCIEYNTLESISHKQAIASTIRHRKSAFNGELPLHVQQCLNSIN